MVSARPCRTGGAALEGCVFRAQERRRPGRPTLPREKRSWRFAGENGSALAKDFSGFAGLWLAEVWMLYGSPGVPKGFLPEGKARKTVAECNAVHAVFL